MQGFNILVFIIMLNAVHASTYISFLYWLMLMLAFFCLYWMFQFEGHSTQCSQLTIYNLKGNVYVIEKVAVF